MADIIPFSTEGVRGFLHLPDGIAGRGLVLTHGAGGNCQAPLLVAAAAAFSAAGVAVLRCDLPFRQRRPKGPPSPAGAAEHRAGLQRAVAALRTVVPQAIILLARSIRDRFPYLDPLNHMQIELLKRYRGGDTNEAVVSGIHLTINGIAAGLRNSG